MLAEALHRTSARSGGPFVVFDCTTVAPSLLESALFGHERGAFTGASSSAAASSSRRTAARSSSTRSASSNLALQPKLLRAIERREVQRVGGGQWPRIDVRILAATRRDLDHEVQAGRFRDDLFFRLAVGRIELPPLRRRTGDVEVLARHFWRELAGAGAQCPTGSSSG